MALHTSREQPKPSTQKSAWAKFHGALDSHIWVSKVSKKGYTV